MSDIALKEQHTKLRTMIQQLAMETELDTAQGSSSDFVYDLMERILNATDADEVFSNQEAGTLSGKDYQNIPFRLRSENIQWKRTNLNNSVDSGTFPFYAMFNVTEIGTGDEQTVSCGGSTFVVSLRRLQELGYLDKDPDGAPLVITGKATPSGNTILFLKPYRVPTREAKK